MKFSIMSLGLMAVSALATPMRLTKRAALQDVATTGYATMNGGTTGGRGGAVVEVSSLSALTNAVKGDSAAIILITRPIRGNREDVRIGSNKSIIGKDSSVRLENFTLTVKNARNVIIRNLAMSKVVGGDCISLQFADNIWIDHVELSSDRNNGKDYYDGLLDVTHAASFVTVSNTFLHDHYKTSLVGHSDNNGAEDRGHLTITYHNNLWLNLGSRAPSLRFGTGHIYNNYYENVSDAINTRQGAQVLVQNNVFVGCKKALFSTDNGYAVVQGNDFGGASNSAPRGSLTQMPYNVPRLLDASQVKAAVVGTAGVTLRF